MDKHKFERFLHPGRFVVASIFAPISFPPLPLLVFKEATLGDRRGAAGAATLVASGSLRSVDPDRIVLKKITLSGYLFIQLSPNFSQITPNWGNSHKSIIMSLIDLHCMLYSLETEN